MNATPDVFVRRAVSKLDRSRGVPRELADYAEGIRAMRSLPATDPRSLAYQAAIHGRSSAPPQTGDWNWCQHQNWFFLPWHRMYLRQFERILGSLIGKPRWRLPYWDYTSDDEAAWSVPREFLQPADANRNPLYVAGRLRTRLARDWRDAEPALAVRWFAIRGNGFGFGSGRVERPVHLGAEQTGALEGTPHNIVHGAIGHWMNSVDNAPLDPIFWLHHASIDRLWDVWLNRGSRANPLARVWRETRFSFPDVSGHATFRVRDVLRTEALGYRYDDVGRPPDDEAREPEGEPEPELEPEAVGTTPGAVPLDPGSTHAVELEPPARWRRGEGLGDEELPADAGPTLAQHVLLQLENVTGTDVGVAIYGVYVNVPEGDDPTAHPELKAGVFGTFALEEATAEGGAITQSFDITEIARRLAADGRWDPDRLRVTFVAEASTRESGVGAQNVRAGSIRVFVV